MSTAVEHTATNRQEKLMVFVTIIILIMGISKAPVSPAPVLSFSRSVLEYVIGWGSTTPDEVKLANRNKISCYLSLHAHSDRVLETLKDPLSFGRQLMLEETDLKDVERDLTFENDSIIARGCPASAVTLHVRARIEVDKNTTVAVQLNIGFPPEVQLPIYKGEVGRACEVRTEGHPKRLYLLNFNSWPRDGTKEEATSDAMVFGVGARDVVLSVDGDTLVDTFILLACRENEKLGVHFVPLRKDVPVREIRVKLALTEIEKDLARSFMVVGFHTTDI